MIRARRSPQCIGWRWHASHVLVLVVATTLAAFSVAQATSDTVYVDNTKGCPGGPGTSTSNAYCSISNALGSFSGGANKVVAVMGTGDPYLEQVTIAAEDSGSTSQPLVLFARGAVTIDGSTATTAWVARYASATSPLYARVIRSKSMHPTSL